MNRECAWVMKKFEIGEPVQHVTRDLGEATFAGYSVAGRIKVKYNQYYPFGVSLVVNIFNPSNIVSARVGDISK